MVYMKRAVFLLLYLLITGLLLAACGGSGGGGVSLAGGGIGGTGITTSGTVTGFGSVFVNGIEFDTSGTSFDVDDDPAAGQDDLGIGMVVTVIGTVNDDGVSGSADSIEYDEEIEGPVTSDPSIPLGTGTDPTIGEDADGQTKTFTVFDLKVVVDRNSTIFVNTDYSNLAKDDIVEVSGLFDEFGNLVATRLENKGVLGVGTEVEVKGTVSGCGGNCTGSFTLGTLDVTYDGLTDLTGIPAGVVTDGQFVEVKGFLTPPSSIAASRIELEDEGFGDEVDNISIEGIVTDFNSIGDFKVSGQQVDASGAGVVFQPTSLADSIGNGGEVEVEGLIAGGVLQANGVEQRGGDVKISAVVDSVNSAGGMVTMTIVAGQPLITVTVDEQTQLEDKTGAIENFTIFDINAGDFLNIEAFIGEETLIASQIERTVPEDTGLQGPADVPPTSGDSLSGSVSVLNVTIASDDKTGFQTIDETPLTGMEFYNQVTEGDLVKFQDNMPVDGIADTVEFED